MADIRIALAAERPQLLRMMEESCARDASLSVVGKSFSFRTARQECVKKDVDVLVMWVESAYEECMHLFRSALASTHANLVLVSNNTVLIVEALSNGATDFLSYSAMPDDEMRSKCAMKIPDVVRRANKRPVSVAAPQESAMKTRFNGVVALGASAGGTEATSLVLRHLPANFPGMVIVQHIPPVFSLKYAERLDAECAMHVHEARDWDAVAPGTVLVAPGGKQMTVVRKGDGFAVRVQEGAKVSGHCPSVDMLFHSVASAAGKNAVGVILTGMGDDGAKGLLQMRRSGAYTFGQDEKTSMVYGMPRVAYEMGAVARQAPLDMIPKLLMQYLATK